MQMKDFESFPPLVVERAAGCILYTDKGPILDGISSWWCKSLGHGHPAVTAAIEDQLHRFEHVIAANTTHPLLVELAEKLAEITKNQHIFFASDGSSAVEIAMKLAIHANQIKGNNKNEFIALKNGYHGETFGAMSVSDLGIYKEPYKSLGVNCHFIKNIPYVNNALDPLWSDCENHWQATLQTLEKIKHKVCALILEPLIQGAGGMLCYSADFLKRCATWAKENGIYLIADEIMTGMGRTGKWLACDHAEVKPDLICLSKGLTSGSLPMSCVMIDSAIYDLFYGDYDAGKSFLHSHTYSANPLAISAALATINVMTHENIPQKAQDLHPIMLRNLTQIAAVSGKLENVRGIGAVVAADFINPENRRLSNAFYQIALKNGALLRPIGNTLYWLPPLNSDRDTLEKLADITLKSVRELP